MLSFLLLLAVGFLAYSNGANDNFKGVATLFGSRAASYRVAIWWATATTFTGSICSMLVAQSLLARFSGSGIVPDQVAGSGHFLLAVALGAGTTVIIATVTGFPVSTTHGLTGAILGSGLVGAGVNFQSLESAFLLPLLLSPVLAVVLAGALYMGLRFARSRLGVTKEWCVCVGQTEQVVTLPQPTSTAAVRLAGPLPLEVTTGEHPQCTERYAGTVLGIRAQDVVGCAHFVSAGAVGFARGLNDTPKIAAMLLAAQALEIHRGFVAIAVVMAAGGLLAARRVAETMSHRITSMNHAEALAANLSTSFLVILASRYGLPVSTTHVSVGSLFGVGLTARKADARVVLGIVLSWLLTLPCAALIGAVAYWLAGCLSANPA